MQHPILNENLVSSRVSLKQQLFIEFVVFTSFMEIVFLGTSSMVPTKERNVSALYFKFKRDGILFDCAEGTQRQMNLAGIKRTNVNKIFISHWHGDHVSGIIGLIQTLGAEDQEKLEIYGPKGTKKFMDHMMNSVYFDNKLEIKIVEKDPKGLEVMFEDEDYAIYCSKLIHSTPCIGYRFVEKDKRKILASRLTELGIPEGPHLKDLQAGQSIEFEGKKIDVEDVTVIKKGRVFSYVMDTKPCKNAVILAKDADLLVCEATFLADLDDKADLRAHMTAKDAALLANQAEAKKLVLTHFSQRYKTSDEHQAEAKNYFDNSFCAYDFMKVNL